MERRNFLASVDVVVMGRNTYDMVQQLAPKYLFPPTIKSYGLLTIRTVRCSLDGMTFVSGSIVDWVEGIRKQPGKDIWLVGGRDG